LAGAVSWNRNRISRIEANHQQLAIASPILGVVKGTNVQTVGAVVVAIVVNRVPHDLNHLANTIEDLTAIIGLTLQDDRVGVPTL
jgi:hypothetical protein